MATTASPRQRTTRFSLLLLQHSEVLLSDLAAQYHFIPESAIGSPPDPLSSFPERFLTRSANTSIRGRIKLATHSIFFDSDDWRDPIIRLPLVGVDHARPTRDNSHSRDEDAPSSAVTPVPGPVALSAAAQQRLGKVDDDDDPLDDNSVLVVANTAIFQRELANDHPFIDVRLRGRHVFTPLYTSAVTLLDDINTLLHITSTQTSRTRDLHLRELVHQREARVPFDITLLQHGVHEAAIMDAAASAVYSMAKQPGRFRVTQRNLYFMPIHGESSQAVERIPVESITSVRALKHGCRDAALEVGFQRDDAAPTAASPLVRAQGATLLLAFPSLLVRQRAIELLHTVFNHAVRTYDRRELEAAMSKWRAGTLSTFDYLLHLNLTAGRSFNDLSQYPVFPWVVQDYTSQSLDLTDRKTFRDLSRPIGALDEARINSFLQRYDEMPAPRFLYGTHYSTPAYVIHYLVRAAPAAMLRLQNGRFDSPDRLFHSIEQTWKSVLSNRGDVKELIPEFYAVDPASGMSSGVVSSSSTAGEFLDNVLGLDLGTRQDGIRVDGIELPPWANGSSEIFVQKLREALESDYASQHIHSWIDLIFGVQSRSAGALNLFYTDVALPESIGADEERLINEEEMDQIETIFSEFGRTPEQLFQQAHQPRFADYDVIGSDNGGEVGEVSSGVDSRNHGDVRSVMEGGSFYDKVDVVSPSAKRFLEKDGKGNCLDVPPIWLRDNGSERESTIPSPGGVQNRVLSCSSEDAVRIPRSCMHYLVDGRQRSGGERDEIVDMCIVEEEKGQLWEWKESEDAVFCTAWSSGYVKVHSGRRVVRSKLVGSICCIVYISAGIVAYGCRDGSIGVYDIERARADVVLQGAHEGDVAALAFEKRSFLLVSGSRDGSVKVWRFVDVGCEGGRYGKMRLVQEVDGESCVKDVCVTCEERCSTDERQQASSVMVAAWTVDRSILVWEVALKRGTQQTFTEPVWRWDGGNGGGEDLEEERQRTVVRRRRMVAWVIKKRRKWPHLVLGDEREQCVRVWRLDGDESVPDVYVMEEGGVSSVSTCESTRSILVGGSAGRITELDSTGLCIGHVMVSKVDVVFASARSEGSRLYVWDDSDGISVTNVRETLEERA